jgi:GAF domain-containing protein
LRIFAHYGNLSASAAQKITPFSEKIADYVAASGQPLLIEDISQSPFLSVARYPDTADKSLISVPIILGEQVIGVINVSSPLQSQCFDEEDLELLKLFALFVAKSIHSVQLQAIMRSKFVEIAVARELEEKQTVQMAAIHPNPSKLAKIVAKSFFRELTKAGFGPNQVIEIATEVLYLLKKSLDKHKKRLERDDEED